MKARKKRGSHLRLLPAPPTSANERWAMDFVHHQLLNGGRFRFLTIVDAFTRECPANAADISFTGKKVAAALDQVAVHRGYPKTIRIDNGTAFYSKEMDAWAYRHEVKLDFIRLGKPVENGFNESFNVKLRDELLNAEPFLGLLEARRKL